MMFTVMPGGSMAEGNAAHAMRSLLGGGGSSRPLGARSALSPGANYRAVFHFAASTRSSRTRSRAGRCRSGSRRSWITTIKATVDG